jgi:hypothetical protein
MGAGAGEPAGDAGTGEGDMTVAEVVALLQGQLQDAIVVTQPTAADPKVTIHAPCGGTGFIDGVTDDGCNGTGQNYLPAKVRIIATGGTVTATPIPVTQ